MTWQSWLPGLLTLAVLALYGVVLSWWVRRELGRQSTLILEALKLMQEDHDLHQRLCTDAILDRIDYPSKAT